MGAKVQIPLCYPIFTRFHLDFFKSLGLYLSSFCTCGLKYFFWKNRENTGVKIIVGKKIEYEKDLLDLISTHCGTHKLLTCRHGELF